MNATVIRPGGRPLKVNRWPHDAPYIRTGLGRLHRQGLFWHGARSSATREAGRFLFRPRSWITEQADCVMRDAGLAEQLSRVHIRYRSRNRRRRKIGCCAAKLGRVRYFERYAGATEEEVFLQTASPIALVRFENFCSTNGLQLSYTNNSRSENDAWGGWKGGSEMEQAAVGAINAHIGSQAGVSVSPELSIWTHFLAWTFKGLPGQTIGASRVCCPLKTCRQTRSGSRMLHVFATNALLKSGIATTRRECNVHHLGTMGIDYSKDGQAGAGQEPAESQLP